MKRAFKIIIFFIILVTAMNVSVSFEMESNGHFIQVGNEVHAKTTSPEFHMSGTFEGIDYRRTSDASLIHVKFSASDIFCQVTDVDANNKVTVQYSITNYSLYATDGTTDNNGITFGISWFDSDDNSIAWTRLYDESWLPSICNANIVLSSKTENLSVKPSYFKVLFYFYGDTQWAVGTAYYASSYFQQDSEPYIINTDPTLSNVSPSQNDTLTELTNCIPSITVSDPNGDTLTCKYYIDSIEKESKVISNTATSQIVTFNSLEIKSLSEGSHTFKFEASDGVFDPVTQTVDITVDKLPPTLGSVNFVADDTSITITGTATDNISDTGSLQYRYTVGNTASDWVSNTSWKTGSLPPNTLYNTKFEAKDKVGHIVQTEKTIYTKAQTPQITVNNIKENSMDILISDSNPATTQYQLMVDSSYITATGTLTSSPQWITTTNKKFTVSGLAQNTQYAIKAKAKNGEVAGAETDFSIPINATMLAQPPANIAFEPSINSMKITWNAVNGATSYDVKADGKESNVGTSTSYTHSGLQAETLHTYSVRVRNAGGTGEWSKEFSCTTLPYPPETPTITDTDAAHTVITINWDAVDKATGYEIEADGEVINTKLITAYTDEGLNPNSLHKYRVRAKNAGGESEWSEFTEISTLPNPPEIPENLIGMPTRTNVTLSWNVADRAEGYDIELDGSIRRLESTTTYIHEGLSTNTTYTYKIRAWNKGGISEWSSPKTVTTWPEIPPTPNNIMATAETEAITLTWYSSPFAESYDLQVDGNQIVNVKETSYTNKGLTQGTKHTYKIRAKNISGDGQWSKLVEITTLPKEDTSTTESAALANIVAVVTNKAVTIAWQAVAANAQYEVEVDGVMVDNGKDTVYDHTGLEPVSFHTYRIRTKDVNGNGQWCAVLALSTLPNLPGAPTDVNAIAANTQIQLSWTREEGTGYEIEVDGEVVDAGEVASYIDNNLNPGTAYTYRVRGKNITGFTAWSDSITKSTTSPSYEVDCINGGEFDFSLLASNVQEFGYMTFVVTFNPEELEVADLCEFTANKEITTGKISGTNITVKYTLGRIEFSIDESITPGTTWSGEVTTIVFKPKVDGKVDINFSIE